jgi:hypothetical protein
MVTVCADVYVPVPGVITGIAAGGVMVYTAVDTLLLKKPLAAASASTVCDALTVIGPVYAGEEVVGVVPFVV